MSDGKKNAKTSTVGGVLVILSMLFGAVRFIEVMLSDKAGLGDINFTIGYFAFATMWLVLGFCVIVQHGIVNRDGE